jgi:hypothetical protein
MGSLLKFLLGGGTDRSLASQERAYLDAAVSRYDLERREREVERGLFRRTGHFA